MNQLDFEKLAKEIIAEAKESQDDLSVTNYDRFILILDDNDEPSDKSSYHIYETETECVVFNEDEEEHVKDVNYLLQAGVPIVSAVPTRTEGGQTAPFSHANPTTQPQVP